MRKRTKICQKDDIIGAVCGCHSFVDITLRKKGQVDYKLLEIASINEALLLSPQYH